MSVQRLTLKKIKLYEINIYKYEMVYYIIQIFVFHLEKGVWMSQMQFFLLNWVSQKASKKSNTVESSIAQTLFFWIPLWK